MTGNQQTLPTRKESSTGGGLTTRLDSQMADLRRTLMANVQKLQGMTIDPENAISVCLSSIRKTPKLLECHPSSVLNAINEAGARGWRIDGVLGHAYLVPFKNEATLIPGYRGKRDLVEKAGVLTSMESIHEGDEFESRGRFAEPLHNPGSDPERRYKAAVVGAYVIGVWPTGRLKCFYWTAAECIAHRDKYSQNWRNAVSRSKQADNPWNPDNVHEFAVMCMKTVFNDAFARGEFPTTAAISQYAEREAKLHKSARVDLDAEPLVAIEDASEDANVGRAR